MSNFISNQIGPLAIGATFSGCMPAVLNKLSSLDIRIIDAVIPHWKHAAEFGALAMFTTKCLTKLINKSFKKQASSNPIDQDVTAECKKILLVIVPIFSAISSVYMMKIATNTIIPPSFAILCAIPLAVYNLANVYSSKVNQNRSNIEE